MSGSHPQDNLFPSSYTGMGSNPPASTDDEPDWRAPDYPGDQQNTQWQGIAGNGPGNYDEDLENALFGGDDEDELGPADDFAPDGWSSNNQPLAGPGFEQRTPEPPPGYRHAPSEPPQPGTRHFHGYLHDPSGNTSSYHTSTTNDIGGGRLTVTDINGVVSNYGPAPAHHPPSRQQSVKPEAPYSGYSRNSVSAGAEYQGASDIPSARIASSNLGEFSSDEEGDAQRAFDVFEGSPFFKGGKASGALRNTGEFQRAFDVFEKSPFFKGGKATGAMRNTGEYSHWIPYTSVESLSAAPENHFWAPDAWDGEEELVEDEDDVKGFDTRQAYYQRRRISPTESELEKQGFEFHSELEEEQIALFNDKAFRKALREVKPELPRKQQWYAYRRVADMLDEAGQTEEDGYDPVQPQRDFISEASESHHVCQCGGDPTKCFCAPGQCRCSACPRNQSTDEKPRSGSRPGASRHAHVEDEQGDAPMDIGTAPITPRFPNVYNQHGIQKIPGLGQLSEESERDVQSSSKPAERRHRCQCGDDCRCPPGGCQCAILDDLPEPPQYNPDRLAQHPLGSLIKKAAESQPSSPRTTAFPTPSKHDTPTTDPPSSTQERPYYTPQQGFSFVRSNHDSEASTPLGEPPQITPMPPSRPDTPRPHDSDVRESVEPEMPMPNWHRESTPAYEDRSPSPSLTSRSPMSSRHGDFDLDRADGIDDVNMRDVTPTVPASRAFHRSREGSVAPGSPTSFSRSRLSVPRTSSPSMASSPSRHTMPAPRSPRPESRPSSPRRPPVRDDTPGPDDTPIQATRQARHAIPAPPVPSSTAPGLKTTKLRGKRKSAVHGGKVEKPKSRNVTAKQRKATEKIVKQDTKDTKEGKTKGKGKVAEAVARIEVGMQVDGSPQRRSKRVKDRVASGSPGPDYKGMGG